MAACDASAHAGSARMVVRRPHPPKAGIANSSQTPGGAKRGRRLATRRRTRAGPARRAPTAPAEGGYRRLVANARRSEAGEAACDASAHAGRAGTTCADRTRRRRVSPTRRKRTGGAKRGRRLATRRRTRAGPAPTRRSPHRTEAGIADLSKRPEERSGGGRLATRRRTQAGPARRAPTATTGGWSETATTPRAHRNPSRLEETSKFLHQDRFQPRFRVALSAPSGWLYT